MRNIPCHEMEAMNFIFSFPNHWIYIRTTEPIIQKLDLWSHRLDPASLCPLGLLNESIHQSKKQYKCGCQAKMEIYIVGFILLEGRCRKYWFLAATIIILRPRQNGRLFADDTFKCVFVDENSWISIDISLKLVSKGPIYNIQTLVQIMASGLVGAMPLSESMMVSLLTHICVTRPQWVIWLALANALCWLIIISFQVSAMNDISRNDFGGCTKRNIY